MSHPEWSVVITTYQRPAQLARTLQALGRQNYPKDRFEVIVVNDGGKLPLKPFVSDLCVRFIEQQHAGAAAGRNTGVAHARGAWIAFTDDDCEPRPEWISALSNAAEMHPGCLFGGKTICGLPGHLCSVASQIIQDIVYDFYNSDPAKARFFASNNMALPAGAFRSVGGFDARFRLAAEDRELCERWRAAGRRMVYVPEAVVGHFRRLSLAGFIRQHFRYGRGAASFHRERIRNNLSLLSDHTGFHRNWRAWMFRPWLERPGLRALLLMLLLLIWQVANAVGFVYGWMFNKEALPVLEATGRGL